MTINSNVELDILGLFMLAIIFFSSNKQPGHSRVDQKLFLFTALSTALLLFFDIFTWLLNGVQFEYALELNYFVNVVYFLINPMPCLLWALYVDFKAFEDVRRTKTFFGIFMIPTFVNTVMTIASIKHNVIFTIGADNVYHRGKLYLVMVLITYSYFAFSIICILIKKKHLTRKESNFILLSIVPAFLASVIQNLFYGISVLWLFTAFALLALYLSMQNTQIHTDYLTGLYNRRELNTYLDSCLLTHDYAVLPVGYMLDINRFKSINDTFGHAIGDLALKDAAEILLASVQQNDFVARYGGDEFFILTFLKSRSETELLINRINENLHVFNAEKNRPFNLSFSIGCVVFTSVAYPTTDSFLAAADKEMYNKKMLLDIAD